MTGRTVGYPPACGDRRPATASGTCKPWGGMPRHGLTAS